MSKVQWAEMQDMSELKEKLLEMHRKQLDEAIATLDALSFATLSAYHAIADAFGWTDTLAEMQRQAREKL